MKRIAMLIVAGFLAFGLVGKPASAASYALGVIPANGGALGFGGSIGIGNPPINDDFSFTLSSQSLLGGGVADLALKFGNLIVLDITNFAVQLFDSSNNPVGALFTDGPNSTGLIFGYANLAAGAYHFNVSGSTAGFIGGIYALAFTTVAQTPIPPAILMFLTAMLGLGFVGYRRRTFLS